MSKTCKSIILMKKYSPKLICKMIFKINIRMKKWKIILKYKIIRKDKKVMKMTGEQVCNNLNLMMTNKIMNKKNSTSQKKNYKNQTIKNQWTLVQIKNIYRRTSKWGRKVKMI